MRQAHVRTLVAALLAASAVLPAAASAQTGTAAATAAAEFRAASWGRSTTRAWNASTEVMQRKAYDNAIAAGNTPDKAMAISNAAAAAAPFALASLEEDKATRAEILGYASTALAALGIVASATGVGAAVGVPLLLGAASLAAGTASQICLSTSCGLTVSSDSTGKPVLSGPDVQSLRAATSGNASYFRFQGTADGHDLYAALAFAGYNKTFLCGAYSQDFNFHECMFVAVGVPRPDGDAYGSLRYGEPFSLAQFKFCSGYYRANTCGNDATMTYDAPYQGYASIDAGSLGGGNERTAILLQGPALGNIYGTQPTIPARTFQPVAVSPALGRVSGAVSVKSASEPLSPDAIAALANEIGKRVAANGNPSAWNASAPATSADAQAWQQRNPSRVPTVADALSPINDTGALPKPSTEANPAVDPVDVHVTNPSTSTAGGTSTGSSSSDSKDDDDDELDNDDGQLGDVLKPVKDFVAGPLAPWFAPTLTLPGGQCPWTSFDLGKQWDASGRTKTDVVNTKDVFCGTVDEYTPTLQAILSIIYTFMVPIIIFRRS